MIDVKTGVKELIWTKDPYPENWEYQYGMTQHCLQLNYLPNTLAPLLPPTDSRFRPDQRALENGDFKLAATEKNRLEEKQRAIRRYTEKNKIEHKPAYFKEVKNLDEPNVIQYMYNGLYFEGDRKEKNWSRLPDLYGETLPIEVEQLEAQQKKK